MMEKIYKKTLLDLLKNEGKTSYKRYIFKVAAFVGKCINTVRKLLKKPVY